jgi:hypothetical protein
MPLCDDINCMKGKNLAFQLGREDWTFSKAVLLRSQSCTLVSCITCFYGFSRSPALWFQLLILFWYDPDTLHRGSHQARSCECISVPPSMASSPMQACSGSCQCAAEPCHGMKRTPILRPARPAMGQSACKRSAQPSRSCLRHGSLSAWSIPLPVWARATGSTPYSLFLL